jgi:hypothetical protein
MPCRRRTPAPPLASHAPSSGQNHLPRTRFCPHTGIPSAFRARHAPPAPLRATGRRTSSSRCRRSRCPSHASPRHCPRRHSSRLTKRTTISPHRSASPQSQGASFPAPDRAPPHAMVAAAPASTEPPPPSLLGTNWSPKHPLLLLQKHPSTTPTSSPSPSTALSSTVLLLRHEL